MIYVGVDIGIVESAVVAVDYSGEVRYQRAIADETGGSKGRLEVDRLSKMASRILDNVLLASGGEDEIFVAVEEPFVGKGSASAAKTCALFGAVAYELHNVARKAVSISLITVGPTTVKKYVGAKKKELVARQVLKRFGYENDDLNLVDAYAIARWCLDTITKG